MAKFKKGESGNKDGRPLGAKNKTSERLRATISDFLEKEFPTIQKNFKKLSGKDQAKLYVDLMPFAVPKLQAISMDVDFNKLDEQQLDEIISGIIKKSQDHEQK